MRVVSIVIAAFAFFFATSALAASQRTTLSPDTIEAGESAMLVMTVQPGDQATDPQLSVPAGLTVLGKTVSPSFQISISNGHMTQIVSTRVMFRVRADREGRFTLGAPTVVAGGQRVIGDRTTLRVVARGSLAQRPPDPLDPFGMFGGGNPFQQFDQPQIDLPEPTLPIDPRFNLPAARDSGIFLHATVDKTQAVVGEQVTLTIWVYADITETDPELSDPHEVGTSEFLREAISIPSTVERAGFARAGGRTFAVAMLRKWALFPLHAGVLDITPMQVDIGRRGARSSEALSVRVTEPPMDHRPAGYAVGDVGHFALSADVTPREVERGAAVSVVVDLSGWGNLPSSLTVPARPNVTWLDPEVKNDVKVLDEKTAGAPDVWGGSRTFSYIVTPQKEGDVDLGDISVSFYDPRTRSYGTARATLGTIHVKPGANAPPVADESKPFVNMPPLRDAMSGVRANEPRLDDSRAFFGLLLMPTALFGIAVSARRAAKKFAERSRERKTSPLADLKQRVRALDDARAADDGRAIDGATIRVLESAAVAHASVNVRGVGGEAVASVLTRAGVDAESATELRDLLEACAAARFSPEGVELVDAKKRAERASALVARLEHAQSSSPASDR
jgi:hypothetical protein